MFLNFKTLLLKMGVFVSIFLLICLHINLRPSRDGCYVIYYLLLWTFKKNHDYDAKSNPPWF